MSAIDNDSDPGAWARELAARGTHGPKVLRTYVCLHCSWTGDSPSITDASSVVEREGRIEVDRTHLAVCPSCFNVLPSGEARS